MEAGEEEFWVQKKTLQKQKSQSWIKCILISWMKISASNSPSLLSIPNFTETDKEEEGDVAEEGPREEGPREGPELAPATADLSTYELEGATWPSLLTSHRSPEPLKPAHPQAGYSSYLPSTLKSTHCLYTSHLTEAHGNHSPHFTLPREKPQRDWAF